MTDRKPIVIGSNGVPEELQAGDTLGFLPSSHFGTQQFIGTTPRKPLVINSSGTHEELQSGDELDFLPSNYYGSGADGSVTISANTSLLGSNDDTVGTVKNHTSLTVDVTRILQLGFRSKYLIIYCTGTLTLNGSIDNSNGAIAVPSAIQYTRKQSGSVPGLWTVPSSGAAGGWGGRRKIHNNALESFHHGSVGASGTDGQTGGGGGGGTGAKSLTNAAHSGAGGNGSSGTSFSGGGGGGGAGALASTTSTADAGNAAINGGAGGAGSAGNASTASGGGGGAGNPGGALGVEGGGVGVDGVAGADGTGGCTIIIADTIVCGANAEINAVGKKGGVGGAGTWGGGSGGSGGGGAIITLGRSITDNGLATSVAGGTQTAGGNGSGSNGDGGNGAAGGAGSTSGLDQIL